MWTDGSTTSHHLHPRRSPVRPRHGPASARTWRAGRCRLSYRRGPVFQMRDLVQPLHLRLHCCTPRTLAVGATAAAALAPCHLQLKRGCLLPRTLAPKQELNGSFQPPYNHALHHTAVPGPGRRGVKTEKSHKKHNKKAKKVAVRHPTPVPTYSTRAICVATISHQHCRMFYLCVIDFALGCKAVHCMVQCCKHPLDNVHQ